MCLKLRNILIILFMLVKVQRKRESEIVLEMARRCKPRMHFCDTFTFNHPEKGKHMLKLLVN